MKNVIWYGILFHKGGGGGFVDRMVQKIRKGYDKLWALHFNNKKIQPFAKRIRLSQHPQYKAYNTFNKKLEIDRKSVV